MDPEAYRCPKCYIYFCFKCRVRVMERDPQFQCADQSCPCYGKLLCAACTVMVPEFMDVTSTEYDSVIDVPSRTIIVGDNFGWAAFIVPVAIGIALWMKLSLWFGVVGVVGAFIVIAIILNKSGSTWFKRNELIPPTMRSVPREITENKQVAEHRCCIQCKHPIKVLR